MSEAIVRDLNNENLKRIFKEALSDLIPKKEEKATLTIDECAEFSGIGRNKILELVHKQNSDFPCFKVGSKFLINRDMFINWLNKVTEEGRIL